LMNSVKLPKWESLSEWKGRIKFWWIYALPFITLLILGILFISYPDFFNTTNVTLVMQAHYWISFMLSVIVERSFNRLRSHGYLYLYKTTIVLIVAVPMILSVGNSALLIVWSAWPDGENNHFLKRSTIVDIIIILDVLGLLPFFIFYIWTVKKHYDKEHGPDKSGKLPYNKESIMNSKDMDNQDINSVVEDQAEIVEWYKEQREDLSKEIVVLRKKLDEYEKSSKEFH